MMNFNTVGFSTEEMMALVRKAVDFSEFNTEEKHVLIQCFKEGVVDQADIVDTLNALKDEALTFCEEGGEEEEQYKKEILAGVDFLMGKVDTQGVWFTWAMEYDDNVMFVENVTFEELVDFLGNEEDKLEGEAD